MINSKLKQKKRRTKLVSNKKINEIEAFILKKLLQDGRTEFSKIAKDADTTKDVIWRHYTKMKKEGIIIGSTIQLDYAALGYDMSASMFIDIPPNNSNHVKKKLRAIPGIYHIYTWGVASRLWVVLDFITEEQIDKIKRAISNISSILKFSLDIWTQIKSIPENLSVLNGNRIFTNSKTSEKKLFIENRKKNKKIDDFAKQIIEKLSINSRESFNRIAKELGSSTSTVARRYRTLENNRIIKPLIQLNPTKLGYKRMACFRLVIDPNKNCDYIKQKICSIPDVTGFIKTTGDVMIFAGIKDFDHFTKIENEIASIDCITKMSIPAITQFRVLPYPRQHISTF